MRVFQPLLLALIVTAASCNFDEAFRRYCEGNPQCPREDAGPDLSSQPDLPSDPCPRRERDLSSEPDVPSEPDVTMEPDMRDEPDLPNESPPDTNPNDSSSSLPQLPRSCSTTSDCRPNEYCHPFNLLCMITCVTRADCPDHLDTCADLHGDRGHRVCLCSRNRSCANLGLVCHLTDNLCEPRCSSTEDYCHLFQPPRICDPAGMCQLPCYGNWECPSANQPRCDLATQLCTGCVDASDCSERPDGLTQCDPNGACVRPPPP